MAPLIADLLRIPDLRVLVVDDASPDGTGTEADRLANESAGRVSILHRSGPCGLGLSYVDGMRAALRSDPWEAYVAGGRIAEVPIVFVERREGASKMSARVIAKSVVLPWKLAARPRRGHPRRGRL